MSPLETNLPMDEEEDEVDEAPRPPGRILTFYSYKGGTGRSMALANVAWILASNGARVLTIDWDLEAPGLHRYFRPFLPDPELTETPGIIDFFIHFTEAARLEARDGGRASASAELPWYHHRADLLRYTVTLDYEFPGGGRLSLVGAGQQGPAYGARVNSFQWGEFYERLGGGTFLEAVKARLRGQYDYVLIDSRTGLSDTSGICTVQMPDELVVCFTLNRQSIHGAAATADSADAQRRLASGVAGLRIWPVPMRTERFEKDRLEAGLLSARERFAPFLWHLPPPDRPEYMARIQVPYAPYYAYEELLATIGDLPGLTGSLLESMERLTARITNGEVHAMPRLGRGVREALLARYRPAETQESPPGRFFLSYANADSSLNVVRRIAAEIDRRLGAGAAFWDERVPLGVNLREALDAALHRAEVAVVLIGPQWQRSKGSWHEVELMLASGKRVIPVLYNGAGFDALPPSLQPLRAAELGDNSFDEDVRRLVDQLAHSFAESAAPAVEVDMEDPHRGQFGGRSEHGGRRLTARVAPAAHEWFSVDLAVEAVDGAVAAVAAVAADVGGLEAVDKGGLQGDVVFHLHPTFRPDVVTVAVQDGVAKLSVMAWGAFTVGAVTDEGLTRLELNLAELSDAPAAFRNR